MDTCGIENEDFLSIEKVYEAAADGYTVTTTASVGTDSLSYTRLDTMTMQELAALTDLCEKRLLYMGREVNLQPSDKRKNADYRVASRVWSKLQEEIGRRLNDIADREMK